MKSIVSFGFASFLMSGTLLAESKQTLNIQGMTCSACASQVEEAFLKTGKVASIEVDAKNGIANVVWKNEKPSDAEVSQIVKQAGFSLKSSS